MCKISAPSGSYSQGIETPISWEDFSSNFNLLASNDKLIEEEWDPDTEPIYFGSEKSLFPFEYDMSMFGLFEPIPAIEENPVLIEHHIQLLEESVVSNDLKASSDSTSDSTSLKDGSDSTALKALSESTSLKARSDSGSSISINSSTNLTSRQQKRKIGNTNAKKSEDGISDELRKKRLKQREAARRCRDKKMSALQIAEERADRAEAEKQELLFKVRVLEEAKKDWIAKEQRMQQEILNLNCKMHF